MAQVEKQASSVPATFEWEYAPAPEARDIVQIRDRYGLYIGGEEVEPRTGEWFPSADAFVSPFTVYSYLIASLSGSDEPAADRLTANGTAPFVTSAVRLTFGARFPLLKCRWPR